jgi:hypothetical protein
MSTIQCASYCKHGAKYCAHPPLYAMWTVVPDIYNEITARIFRLQYSAVGNCAVIVDITTIQCALYCKPGAKYSAPPPVYAMCTVVPDIYKVFTASHIQATIFNWTYLRCYWKYHDNSVCVILQTWCQIQRTSSSFRCVNCGLCYLQSISSSAYLGFNIHCRYLRCYCRYRINSMRVILQTWCQI